MEGVSGAREGGIISHPKAVELSVGSSSGNEIENKSIKVQSKL